VIDIHIRIPAALAKKLKAQAEANVRSIAAEIIYILGKALK
jgi:hypothetical protein